MAERIPGAPQIDDPQILADFIRAIPIRGKLGELNVLDVLLPTFQIGTLTPVQVTLQQPSFGSAFLFSAGHQVAVAANFVHADTLGLPAGTYEVMFGISTGGESGNIPWTVEHRNAANTVTLASLPLVTEAEGNVHGPFALAYDFGATERLRIVNGTLFGGGSRSAAWIYARIRP